VGMAGVGAEGEGAEVGKRWQKEKLWTIVMEIVWLGNIFEL